MPEVTIDTDPQGSQQVLDEDIQKALAKKQKKVATAYKKVFSTPEGKIVLKDMMRSCKFLEADYMGDPNETHFQLGMRFVVSRIFKTMAMPLDHITKMILEANSENFENV